ncbi:hypothetical protein [Burkholderia sola]|uniref:hypothetical protein n=1 Tax=Burkholderia sola TaxID=2843302 RepID=UPI0023DE09D1|nr:hypothetical protein [Burkholderia sola]MDF3080578.1 hypothetical protein [Burkholderia sola]
MWLNRPLRAAAAFRRQKRATRPMPALRYIREAFRLVALLPAPDTVSLPPIDSLLDRLRDPVPTGLAARCRIAAQHYSTIVRRRWYGICIPFGQKPRP